MKNLIESAKALAAAAAAEGRALTDEEKATVEAALAGAKAMKQDRELAQAVEALGADLGDVKPADGEKAAGTPGERLVSDAAFKSWLGAAGSQPADVKSLPNSPAVPVGGLKATITGASDSYAGALITNDRYPRVETAYARDLSVLGLLTVASTTSDVVEYARVLPFGAGQSDNGAAPTAEGTAASESQMLFSKETAPVRDVRTFIPVSVRALQDAAQLQALVDAFIRTSISEELENQIISGDGTGENMLGILEVNGTQTQSWDTDAVTSIRRAIRKVKVNGKGNASAVVLHPEDDEAIDLLNESGVYHFGGPAVASTPSIWGVRRVVSEAVPQGTAIVADWSAAVLFERQALQVQVLNQHSDFAVKGLSAIYGNARAAFAVLNPAKFCITTVAD